MNISKIGWCLWQNVQKAKLETIKAKVAGGETEKPMSQKTKGKEETYEIF